MHLHVTRRQNARERRQLSALPLRALLVLSSKTVRAVTARDLTPSVPQQPKQGREWRRQPYQKIGAPQNVPGPHEPLVGQQLLARDRRPRFPFAMLVGPFVVPRMTACQIRCYIEIKNSRLRKELHNRDLDTLAALKARPDHG
jgi:hypothetical protein